jgi:glycosyltransferase involved in cell wall biosynthesis
MVDRSNYNAQSLNVREIVRRLDPQLFSATTFFADAPDPRLQDLSHVSLVRLPRRAGTLTMLREASKGHEILFSPSSDLRFTQLYFQLPALLRRGGVVVGWLEGEIKGNFEGLDPIHLRRYIRVSGSVDVHVAITDHVAETSQHDYGIHSEAVIPAGVDMEVFGAVDRSVRRQNPRVLFVGHLIERKGPHLVVEAAKQFPQAQFTLVGSPRSEFGHRLLERVAADGPPNIEFLEPRSQTELAQVIASCDLLLHPSRVEGLPKVVLEAAATGLPAIIFRDYRAPAVIDGVTGYQVQDRVQMMNCLGDLIRDPSLRRQMGDAAVKHARSFSWDPIVKRWEEFFLGLVASQ